jgi:hypothetical protein
VEPLKMGDLAVVDVPVDGRCVVCGLAAWSSVARVLLADESRA